MSLAHAIYIPICVGVGVYLGYALGARSVRQAWEAAERRRLREEA